MYGPLAIFDKRIQGFTKSIAIRQFVHKVAYLNPENLLLTFNCVLIAYTNTKYNFIIIIYVYLLDNSIHHLSNII